uniref:uncharacterized protein LOC125906540 isoform X2 n=1 Tax=Anopheles coluzzii TaxID=1518534 RepID=UPI0020FFA5D8|nr:uncharacterized protein LOC125906540 isoform X2 [Anopheles coluzzii]
MPIRSRSSSLRGCAVPDPVGAALHRSRAVARSCSSSLRGRAVPDPVGAVLHRSRAVARSCSSSLRECAVPDPVGAALHRSRAVARSCSSSLRGRAVPDPVGAVLHRSRAVARSCSSSLRGCAVPEPVGAVLHRSRAVARSCCTPITRGTARLENSTVNKSSVPAHPGPNRTRSPTRQKQLTRAATNPALTGNLSLPQEYVLLATAVLLLQDGDGKWQRIRCIIDSGSQVDAITTDAAQRLRLPLTPGYLILNGVSGNIQITNKTQVSITTTNGTYRRQLNMYLLPGLNDQPTRVIEYAESELPPMNSLADARFSYPGSIDAILGAGVFFDALRSGVRQLSNGLRLLNSKFGWLVGGSLSNIDSSNRYMRSCNSLECGDEFKECIEQFWKVEEITPISTISGISQELDLDEHFKRHLTRAEDNRYVVRIPLRGELTQLGDSLEQAQRRLFSLERRLSRHEPTYDEYRKFMREYLEMGHMTPVQANELHMVRYVIPHSCVIKPDSTTTKLRVVFDASAKSSSGVSLNDIQAIGPVLQPDLMHIWLDFRTQTVVATADIAKMYRQIWVAEPDTWMQCILWRNDPQQSAQMYRLRTVTYGEASSSYLACRALHEAGQEVRSTYPKIADVIQKSFYVDNLSFGAATPEELRDLRTGVERALLNRGMPLRKWASNVPDVIDDIPVEHRESTVQIGDKQAIKMLGLAWCPSEDTFQLIIDDSFFEPIKTVSKRHLVSRIAKLYDPIGMLQPVIIRAKIMMQNLWRDGIEWDEEVSPCVIKEWNEFTAQLPLLRQLQIPRMVLPSETKNASIYGFCDASAKAYGCAIYVRYLNVKGKWKSHLLCSKSRVAPLKELTLPRLELQAALLLAEVYEKIKDVFDTRITQTKWWTDSQVVLSWVRSNNMKWDVFVKNRVAKIQAITHASDWHYVPTKLNPADIVSRGLSARKLISAEFVQLWFEGPPFNSTDETPQQCTYRIPIPDEGAGTSQLLTATIGPTCADLISQYKYHNSFIKTRRHFAWLGRTIHNFRSNTTKIRVNCKQAAEKRNGPLGLDELDHGLKLLLLVMQTSAFPNEVQEKNNTGSVSAKGPFQHLNPIVKDNLIHVQGRLLNADLSDECKLPILVPKAHPFVKVMIRHIHEDNFHAGADFVITEFRSKFWMRDLRRMVIGVLSRCVLCVRARPRQFCQQMGQLPAARVTESPAFTHTGVDLCGPFEVIPGSRSKYKITIYVCIFVCFSTKAIHLEIVENQSTSAFISALLRFVSLRGRPDIIYSDNGRNFVGAEKELSELRKTFNNREFQDDVVGAAAEKGIRFSFIPPRSPNFGGLWEANIKVAKRLLKAASKGAQLNVIELQTLLHQISAILNSRPLTATHTSPDAIEPLTPAHFLIGRPSFAIPAEVMVNDSEGTKTRWKRVQKLSQQFWTRWRTEYLAQLRCSAKWTKKTPNIQTGQIVLVGDDNVPVGRWPMGMVTKIYVGPDGVVRVADVRTGSGTYKRNVRLLAPLPIDPNDETDDEKSAEGDCSQSDRVKDEHFQTTEHEDDPPPLNNIWDGRLRPKGGRNGDR